MATKTNLQDAVDNPPWAEETSSPLDNGEFSKNRNIVVVLGMHRSGTSAITRGLQELGIGLGDNLMGANPSDNPKGYWEDLEMYSLNDKLLAMVGRAWDDLRPIASSNWEGNAIDRLRIEAIELVTRKTAETPLWGFKDPRTARLLPFWKPIFENLGLEPRYLICIRHPLSVAHSLTARAEFPLEKSCLLWLEHTIAAVTETHGASRIVVDYDLFIENPVRELERVHSALHVGTLDLEALAASEYVRDFLEPGLRHSRYPISALNIPPVTSGLVQDTYGLLLEAARDHRALDEIETLDRWVTGKRIFREIVAFADYFQDCEKQAEQLRSETSAQNSILIQKDTEIRAYSEKIAELTAALKNRDDRVAGMTVVIEALNLDLAERESRIAGLQEESAGLQEEIAGLQEEMDSRDAEIGRLTQSLAERDRLLADHNATLADREALRRTVEELHRSTSWVLTGPFRFISHRLRRVAAASRGAGQFVARDGFSQSVPKAIQVLRQEGPQGIKKWLLSEVISGRPGAPNPLGAAITGSPEGHYALVEVSGGYTYIPPRRPDDIEPIIAAMDSPPLFSIIVPVYNTPVDLLDKLLASVQSQWYPLWQLILADDASPSRETQAALSRISDPRVILLRSDRNQGIAGATNSALARAEGDYVVFLDHDDELTADCLYELALCIERDKPDYLYSDEDKIAPDGSFTEPHFKPDWSPDTMMSTMYVCHVSCVRRSLLEEVGGLRSDYDGCQDWDLVLRLAEKTNRISHIPKVLYHWRIIPASTAADIAAKPYVLDASRRVREDALKRRGLSGTVEPLEQVKGYFRVNYHPRGEPLISVIIPSRDNGKVLSRCLDSINRLSSYRNFELIVLDNGSVEPGTLAYLDRIRSRSRTTVIRHDAPFNFSELNNLGAKGSHGDLLLFLNDDTEVISPDWLERMAGFAQLTHIGAVGAKLLYPGGQEVQHAGVVNLEEGPKHAFIHQDADHPGYFVRNLLEYDWLAVTGACLMVEREKFLSVGGFDETFPIAYNDIELCFRLVEAGYFNVVCQAARLIHHESLSRGLDHHSREKRVRLKKEKRHLFETHPHYFQHDPFYNPNLHPNGINFEIAG